MADEVKRRARLALVGAGEADVAPQRIKVNLPAAVRRLREDDWACLRLNERTQELVFVTRPPCETAHPSFPAALTDADFTSIVAAFDSENASVARETVIQATVRAASFRSFDPVKDYLETLKWDRTERLTWWLENYFGAGVDEEEDEQAQEREARWNREIGRRWMIGAVARVYEPGCQLDTILIAEGPQGVGKSSAFKALCARDEWFACSVPDIRSKDAVHYLIGPWLTELDELDALSRREATSVKSFVSRRTDRTRLSYGRLSTNHPRRVAFCGTTNEDAWNVDATGGRRFWPFKVRCPIDVKGIQRDRDKLWAEAVAQFKAGAAWYLDDDELVEIARGEQRKRFKASPWLDAVDEYLIGRTEARVVDILDYLEVPTAQRGQQHMNEAVRCLQHLGWERRQVRRGDGRVRVYMPSLAPKEDDGRHDDDPNVNEKEE